MAEWSNMPFDLLHDILMRFETFKDLVYFSVVCRSWNHIATTIKNDFIVKTTPWLLLAECTEDNPHCLRKIFNPITEKSYQLSLPEISCCRCWGSAYGWIVILTYDFEFYLFNPLTKARLSLPPASCLPFNTWTSPEFCNKTDENVAAYKRSHFFKKAFVLNVDDEFVVFLTYKYSYKNLAFAKPGDRSWTSIEEPLALSDFPGSSVVLDIICHDAQILILFDDASIGYLDVSDLSDPEKFIVTGRVSKDSMLVSDPRNLGIRAKYYVHAHPRILDNLSSEYTLYLVESSGDLFMVVRDRYFVTDEKKDVYVTGEFLVYKLDFDTRKWFEVHDLGDVAFFVGNNSSMSIRETEASERSSNCIHYTDDESEHWFSVFNGGADMGVFYLEDRELYDIYFGCDKYSKLQTPLWFVPKF